MLTRMPVAQWVSNSQAYNLARGAEGYGVQSAGQPWSIRRSANMPLIDRIEVRSGDVRPLDPSTSERAEFAGTRSLPFKRKIRVDYDLLLVPGLAYTSSFFVVGQMHATEDAGDGFFSPPFAFYVDGGDLIVDMRSSASPITTANPPSDTRLLKSKVVMGTWTRIGCDLVLDWTAGGVGGTSISVDGASVLNVSKPIGYNDAEGPKWKYGIYRHSSPETAGVLYHNMQVGTGAAQSRITTPPPLSMLNL